MIDTIEQTWLRHRGSLLPNAAAVAYCVAAYFGGAWLILSLHPAAMAAGTLAMAHGMVIAAYLIHDCGHHALFRVPHHNARLGEALNWLAGGCYGPFQELRLAHMRHHVDHTDAAILDHRGWLRRHPRLLRVIRALEWCYLPAVEWLMHAMLVLAPFAPGEGKAAARRRVLAVAALRWSILAAAWLYSPAAGACYLVACSLMMTLLRFMDALQHSYETAPRMPGDAGMPARRGDRAYEQAHTFSNPISLKHPWLNLLVLNFGYHGAHHARPTTPWHALPALHLARHGDDASRVIPFSRQLSNFHRNRVARVLGDDGESEGDRFARRLREGTAVGASGVSFLTPF